MLDWKDYQRELLARLGEMGKLTPATIEGYRRLSAAESGGGQFDPKTRELIAVACAVTLRCDGCITVHTAAALKHGATREEFAEAIGIAVALGAGAALVYSVRALDALADHSASTTVAA